MASLIRNNSKINGITIGEYERKLVQFADDTSCILADIESVENLFDSLKYFSKFSGLKLNIEKSTLLWVGPWRETNIPQTLQVTVERGSINILGVFIGYDVANNTTENFVKKLAAMKNKFNIWSFRNLTLLGRINLAKAIGISNLVYSMTMTETSLNILHEAQTIINKFVWKDSPPRVKHSSLIASYDNGGLKAPDIVSQYKALRLAWLARISNSKPWCSIAITFFDKYGGLDFLKHCNYDGNSLYLLPTFYKNMMIFLKEMYPNPDSYKIIWNNKEILIEGKSIFWKTWQNRGIIFIQDLLDSNNKILSLSDLHQKFGISNDIMKYNSLISAIVDARRHNIMYSSIKYNSDVIDFERNIFLSFNDTNIPFHCGRSKLYYSEFVKHLSKEPTSIAYWQNNTGVPTKVFFQSLSLARASCKEVRLVEFQYKIIHDFVNVNQKLLIWGLIDSPKCVNCENEDSIIHYLFRCEAVKRFIKQSIDYINRHTESKITYSEYEYFFGVRDKAVNHIFVIIKYTIWFLKNSGKPLNINVFLFQLYKRIKADDHYKSRGSFHIKWKRYSTLYNVLKNSFE